MVQNYNLMVQIYNVLKLEKYGFSTFSDELVSLKCFKILKFVPRKLTGTKLSYLSLKIPLDGIS